MRTVIWKEWHSLLGGGFAASGQLDEGKYFGFLPPSIQRYLSTSAPRILITPVIFGALAGSGTQMHSVFIIAIILGGAMVGAESFAGERERGTLETLLASPLSDSAIAGGKILASWLYVVLMMTVFVVAMVFVRLIAFGVSAFSPHLVVQAGVSVAMALLLAFVVVGAATVASTWARTTRVAMQTTYLGFFAVGGLVLVAKDLHLIPNLRSFLAHMARHGWTLQNTGEVAIVLIVLNAAVYWIARLRCSREVLLAKI